MSHKWEEKKPEFTLIDKLQDQLKKLKEELEERKTELEDHEDHNDG